jgi:hypothetical protein
MALENIVQTFEQNIALKKQHSGSFYNGHKIINDPIHVNRSRNLFFCLQSTNMLFVCFFFDRDMFGWTIIQSSLLIHLSFKD